MSGWNMPPGVSVNDIPGNTGDDGEDARSGLDRRINKRRMAGDYVANGDTAHEIVGRRALVFDGEDAYVYAERRKP